MRLSIYAYPDNTYKKLKLRLQSTAKTGQYVMFRKKYSKMEAS